MIDTMLDAVYAAGIEEVVVVRGYLGEQFDQLLYKYPGIRFVENPLAIMETNNISSAFCARNLAAKRICDGRRSGAVTIRALLPNTSMPPITWACRWSGRTTGALR